MTTLVIAALFIATLAYVLWPVFRAPAPAAEVGAPPAAKADGKPLPLEQLQPPPGER